MYLRPRSEHEYHTAEKVNVLTTVRLHPTEVGPGLLVNASLSMVGLDPAAAAPAFAIYLYYNHSIHTIVRIRYPGRFKYVLVSPFIHQWHHAKDPFAMGKNVGVIFAWNDWLFRTAYDPDHWPTEIGLFATGAEPVPQSYLRHCLDPLQFFLARINLLRSPSPTRGPSSP